MKIIVGPVKIGWHDGDEVAAMLFPVGLTELDARDFGQRIGLVRLFERSGEKRLLLDGLRRFAGVNAGGTEEQKLLDPSLNAAWMTFSSIMRFW